MREVVLLIIAVVVLIVWFFNYKSSVESSDRVGEMIEEVKCRIEMIDSGKEIRLMEIDSIVDDVFRNMTYEAE